MVSTRPTGEARSSADWFDVDVVGDGDYHRALAEKRRQAPVHRLLPFDGGRGPDMYGVFRRQDVVRVLRDQATFSLDVVRQHYGAVLGTRTLVSFDSTEHRSHRGALAPALAPGRLPELVNAGVVPAVEELAGSLEGRRVVDLVPDFATRLPALVLTLVLGLPHDAASRLAALSAAVAGFMARPVAGVRAARTLRRMLGEVVADRRRSPRADLISELCQAEIDGQPIDEADLVSLLVLLVWAGTETAGPALSNVLYALLVHPERLRQVRDDPGLLPGAVEEGLRWETPVQWTCRTVAFPAHVHGTRIPPGSLVLAHLGSANRDEAHYPDPARFDIGRCPADHVALGHGAHHCLGSHLGRAELRVALRALLARFPEVSLVGAPPVMTGQLVRAPSHLRVRVS